MLQATPTKRWDAHCNYLSSSAMTKYALICIFIKLEKEICVILLYQGHTSPEIHIKACTKELKKNEVHVELWVNYFIHTLGPIPKDWYLKEEMTRKTSIWDVLVSQFCVDFNFSNEYVCLVEYLKVVKRVSFPTRNSFLEFLDNSSCGVIPDSGFQKVVACRKINKELDDEQLEGLRNLSFKELEGNHNIKDDPPLVSHNLKPLMLPKFNNFSDKKPKLASTGDC